MGGKEGVGLEPGQVNKAIPREHREGCPTLCHFDTAWPLLLWLWKREIQGSETIPKEERSLFLSCGLGELGGPEMVKVSVYKEFLESPSLNFLLEWQEEGMGMCWFCDWSGESLVLRVDGETRVAKRKMR